MSVSVNVSPSLHEANFSTRNHLSGREGCWGDRQDAEAQGFRAESILGTGGGGQADKSSQREEVEVEAHDSSGSRGLVEWDESDVRNKYVSLGESEFIPFQR